MHATLATLLALLAQGAPAPEEGVPLPARLEIERFAASLDEGGGLRVGALEGTRSEHFDALGRLVRWEDRGPDGARLLTWIAFFEGDGPSPSQSAYWPQDQAEPYLEEVVSTPDGRVQDVLYGELGRKRRREMRTYLDDWGREIYQEYFAPRSQRRYGDEVYRYDAQGNLLGKLWQHVDGVRRRETTYTIEERDGFGRWTARRVSVDGELVALERRTIVDGSARAACPPATAGPVEPSSEVLPIPFARGRVSTSAQGESSPSFSADGRTLAFTRYGEQWTEQTPHLVRWEEGAWREAAAPELSAPIYNVALAPDGARMLACRRDDTLPGARVLLLERTDEGWSQAVDLSERDGLYGSYLHLRADDVLTYHRDGELFERTLGQDDERSLGAPVNTPDGVEFAAWTSADGELLLFTRSVEVDDARSGVFAARRAGEGWGPPRRLPLPYGWSARLHPDGEDLVYVVEGDVCRVPVALLDLP